ncbi:cytochrome P450 2G1-like [Lissotriton helveticus]
MDFFGIVTSLLIAWLSCLFLIIAWNKKLNLPPGPFPLPLIGNFLQIKSGEIVSSLLALRKKYGDVFTVYLGPRRVIVVCGYEAVKEGLIDQGNDFGGRGTAPSFDKVYKNHGLAFTNNNERWKQMRRFSLTTFRNFGVGKRSIEQRVQEEAKCMLDEIRNKKGSPFNPRDLFGTITTNIIVSIMFGNRCDYKDSELLSVTRMINDCFHKMSSFWGQLYDTYPRVMDFLPGPHHKISNILVDLLAFTEKKVKINQGTLDLSNPRDYIDCFLIRMDQEKQNPATEFNMANLLSSTLQIFFAGVETTATTLTYGCLILLKYPKVKEKVQDEIDQVIGRHRQSSIEDRNKMPYTDAVIHEIQRYSNILPFGAPHSVTCNTQFRGYNIPKGTDVFFMLGTVLWDPEKFSSPEEFTPQNFLNDDGSFKKNDAFLPFSAGKRICIAEGLARMELFILLTTLLQNFDIKPVVNQEELDITPVTSGFGQFPRAYQLYITPR